MRFDGTLKSWNEERGFGFITPRQGGQDVFVHISAFPPHGGRQPAAGEALTFEVETAPDGKKRAMRVQRPGEHSAPPTFAHRSRPRMAARGRSGLGRAVLLLAVIAALGWYAYGRYAQRLARPAAIAQPPSRPSPPRPNRHRRCPSPRPASVATVGRIARK